MNRDIPCVNIMHPKDPGRHSKIKILCPRLNPAVGYRLRHTFMNAEML